MPMSIPIDIDIIFDENPTLDTYPENWSSCNTTSEIKSLKISCSTESSKSDEIEFTFTTRTIGDQTTEIKR